MKRFQLIGLFLVLLILSLPVFAADVGFYVIYPDGEGDAESARPYLQGLFDYLGETLQTTFIGEYVNDIEDAEAILKEKKVQLAIVSPEFFESYSSKYDFKPILKTIPLYSTGPYERYYIMADKSTDVLALMDQPVSVNLFASKSYDDKFLNEEIFAGNEDIKKIPWRLQQTEDILDAINKIAEGKTNTFVLLTGYEFSVVSKLKKSNPIFAKLKLVYTSKELPSAVLVGVGQAAFGDVEKFKAAFLAMATSLKGNLVLKNLRLKGFSN